MADLRAPRRRRAVGRMAIGLGLVGVAVGIVGVALEPALSLGASMLRVLPEKLVYGIGVVPVLLLAAIALFGLAHIAIGVYDLLEDTHRKSPLRERRHQVTGDLVLGGFLAAAAIAILALAHGTRVWGVGTFAITGLTVTVSVLVLCRAAATAWPTASPVTAIVPLLAGIAVLFLGIANVDGSSTSGVFVILALLVLGLSLMTEGLSRAIALRPPKATRIAIAPPVADSPHKGRRALIRDLVIGAALVTFGIVVTIVTYRNAQGAAAPSTGRYVIAYGPIVAGVTWMGRALLKGFKLFVAWRYLLVYEIQVTRRAVVALVLAIFAGVYAGLSSTGRLGAFGASQPQVLLFGIVCFACVAWAWGLVRHAKLAFLVFVAGTIVSLALIVTTDVLRTMAPAMTMDDYLAPVDQYAPLRRTLGIVMLISSLAAGLAWYFGTLRAFFTFFTTVPIGGVWIGTAALVQVLAVMSGFETDLRDKILGSNAHIQITREDGTFTDWRAVKDRIDRIPGVVASTPYAVSEVVIAAHNNGMNVIIKGIDPNTVGGVTDLISDLEDRDAIKRLEPKAEDDSHRIVPQTPRTPDPDVVDPPPDDMPVGGDPIDFSAPPAEPDPQHEPLPIPRASDGIQLAPPVPYGGDAAELLEEDVVDPPPPDMLTVDEPPIDFSEPGSATPSAIPASDLPIESTVSKRVESLPGVLVGRELVKQTHLYTGEEVRIVSPLSDPSNPDATGTPIPFNRDYRVAGVFYTGMYEYDLKYVYVTLDSLQDFLDRGDEIDGIEVRIGDPDDTERFVPSALGPGLIREALGPGYRVADWRELNRSLFAALKLEKIGMFIVLGIVILVASFSIVGNLIMVVVEKAREIALLKTLGASDFALTQLFAIQGLIIGAIGTVLGVAFGLVACWAGKHYGIPLNPDVYYIDKLPVHVDVESVVAAALAGIVISILATLYPAIVAARVRPAAGMRH